MFAAVFKTYYPRPNAKVRQQRTVIFFVVAFLQFTSEAQRAMKVYKTSLSHCKIL